MTDLRPLPLLRQSPLLGCAREPHLVELARVSQVREVPSGRPLLRTGERLDAIVMLASGVVELVRRNRETKAQLLVGSISAPAVLGDAELYGRRATWSVTGLAAGPVTCVLIPVEAFDGLVSKDGEVAARLYRNSAARHLLSIEITQVLGLQKMEHKILRLLWDARDPTAEGEPFTSSLSQVRLASALASHPRTIHRHLAALEASGLLSRRGRQVVLHVSDPAIFGGSLAAQGATTAWRLPQRKR